MIDKNQEKAESSAWLENRDGDMTMDEIVYKTIHKRECSQECLSKKYSEEGMCRCIRDNFPTLDHYLLSEKLKEKLNDAVALGAFATLIEFPLSAGRTEESQDDGKDK